MSDERTQSPSQLRRQQVRQRGQVARSPELTSAVGLLAAVLLLGTFGGDLALSLLELVRAPWLSSPATAADLAEVVARVRHAALAVAIPLGFIGGGVTLAMLVAHQVQVGGLWVPGLLAPDPTRLWGLGENSGLRARTGRGVWSLARALVVLSVAGGMIFWQLPTLDRLGHLDAHQLARASGIVLGRLAFALALVILALGVVDYWLQHVRFEAQLRLTPQEQREDQRAEDGDPALRARRRRLAQAWNQDPRALLAGASLVLTGAAGLTVVLAGGPPPRRFWVREPAQGPAGLRVRAAAQRAGLPCIEAPTLARRLARRPAAGSTLPAGVRAELAACWPVRSNDKT
jgi:flagellar biosynthesis protein FlhB